MRPPSSHHRVGGGEPLVLLHGMACSWRVWMPTIPELSRHHDVLALTLPGHRGGAEPPRSGRFGLADLVDLVERDLDAHHISSAHLAANSLGGAVAFELLRRGRARSVTAFSPAGAWTTDADLERVARTFREAFRMSRVRPLVALASRNAKLRQVALRGGFERGDRMSPQDFREFMADVRGSSSVFDRLSGELIAAGPIEKVDCHGAPVVIAWPDRDLLLPFKYFGAPYVDVVPGSQLVRLPGVGHGPFYDDPDLMVRTILSTTKSMTSFTQKVHPTQSFQPLESGEYGQPNRRVKP